MWPINSSVLKCRRKLSVEDSFKLEQLQRKMNSCQSWSALYLAQPMLEWSLLKAAAFSGDSKAQSHLTKPGMTEQLHADNSTPSTASRNTILYGTRLHTHATKADHGEVESHWLLRPINHSCVATHKPLVWNYSTPTAVCPINSYTSRKATQYVCASATHIAWSISVVHTWQKPAIRSIF